MTSTEPTIVVEGGLRPGRHRFRLVVVDDSGHRSRPAEVVVTVLPPDRGRRGVVRATHDV